MIAKIFKALFGKRLSKQAQIDALHGLIRDLELRISELESAQGDLSRELQSVENSLER